MLKEKLKNQLIIEEDKLKYYEEEVKEYTKKYGNEGCDYLRFRIGMEIHHRGRVLLLRDLLK